MAYNSLKTRSRQRTASWGTASTRERGYNGSTFDRRRPAATGARGSFFRLLASNTLITLGSAMGFLRATRNFAVYAAVAAITAAFSLGVGTIFLLGKTTVLPALFGG